MKKWLVALFMFVSLPVLAAGVREGVDYKLLPVPQPVAQKDKIEVIEFFSYGCVHCFNLEPSVVTWQKKLPADVSFRQEQIVWDKSMEPFARLFASIRMSGQSSKLHEPAFSAVMKEKRNLTQSEAVKAWVKEQGVDADKFMQIYQSFSVNGEVARALKMTRSYQVEATPSFVIAGKYVPLTAEPQRLLQVVDALIAKARDERK